MITNFFIKVNLSNLRIENFIFSKNNKNYFESSDVEVYTNSKVILDKNNIKMMLRSLPIYILKTSIVLMMV